MRPILSGKVLFVFSDPGGAKPCLSLIELNNLSNVIAVSDRNYTFYNNFKTKVSIITHDFEELVDTFKPKLIFTGTSYTSDIERKFIKIAKDKQIKCISFIDHWTSMLNRFINSDGKLILPDEVWVIDERAKKLAIEEGINEAKLIISENPYHDWINKWTPKISKEEFLKDIGFQDYSKRLIIYAPDPLSNINGKEIYGFDELSATYSISNIFESYQNELKDWKVLLKMHPNQDKLKLKKVLKDCGRITILPETVDTNTVIFYADVVLGFFSSFLIEASLMKKTIVRFLDDHNGVDPIEDLKLGIMVNRNTFVPTLLNIKKE